MSNYLFISDAAKEVKVESHVLRYWEEELHLPIKRNELGHRYYTEEDVERFKQIKGMKERGLQLKAIKMILKDGKLDMLVPKEVNKPTQEKDQEPTHEKRKEMTQEKDQELTQKKDQEPEKDQEPTQEKVKESPQIHVQGRLKEEIKGQETIADSISIDIVESKETVVSTENKEDKSRRLQWLLQQLIRETLQENNSELCREIKESVVKELDYQFRMQEERDEARDKLLAEQNEEHFRKMDELLRKKAKRKVIKEKADIEVKADAKHEVDEAIKEKTEKKKRHFIF